MRIRTQFIITMLLFGVIAVVISASAVITNRRVQIVAEQEDIANSIAQGASELSYLSNDYVIYRENQQLSRWQASFASFSAKAATMQANSAEQMALVNNIQANTRRLKEVFDGIVAAASGSQARGTAIDLSFLQVTWSRMAVQSQSLVTDATRLSELLRAEAEQLKQTNMIVILALVAVFGAYFVVNYILIQRRVLRSIAVLQAGTAVIGSGDLDFKFETKRNDEISDLANAFNRMTSSLKEVTASKTDLERIQVELNRQLAKYEATFASMVVGVGVYDREGRLLSMNSAGREMLSITQADMANTLKERIADVKAEMPDGKPVNPEESIPARALRGETVRDYVFRVRPESGGVRWLMGNGSPIQMDSGEVIGAVLTFVDITERKRAEDEISHLASFPELNPEPVIELNTSGNVQYANPAAGKRFPDLPEKGTKHPFLLGWEGLAQTLASIDTPSVTRDINVGNSWYEQTVYCVPATQSYRLYARDITERKKAEEELKKSNIELEEANKELEAFSYSVSHDLREPLRAIDGFSRILSEEHKEKLDAEGQRMLQTIMKGTSRMGQLITDLLAFSRLSRQYMKSSKIDMKSLAQSVSDELVSATQGRNLDIRVGELPSARGDPALLQQVLANLISNAIKFTKPRDKAVVEVAGWTSPEESVYYVKDNGVGFDDRYINKLFGIFQRLHTQEQFEGTGVGLAIVQRIVHRHGGRVWAESKLGEGATFYFTLPGRGD